MYIGTVHSLCQRLIADRRFYPNRHRGRVPSLLDELAQYFYVYKNRMWAELTQVAGLEDQANLKISSLFGGNGSLSKYLAVTNSLTLFNRLSEECIDPQVAMQQTPEPTLKAMLEMYAIYERSLGSARGTALTDFSLLQQKALQVLGCAQIADRLPGTLPYALQKKVALARAFINLPQHLLLFF